MDVEPAQAMLNFIPHDYTCAATPFNTWDKSHSSPCALESISIWSIFYAKLRENNENRILFDE